MRLRYSEFAHDYATYSFGYTLHGELEKSDQTPAVYEAGFLPYSAKPDRHNLVYMARSVRVIVSDFVPTSENRRVFKKFDGAFTTKILTRKEIAADAAFQKLFLQYFEARHGKGIMGRTRLNGILESVLPLRGIRYEDKDGTLVAAVFEPAEGPIAHFWFPAYDPAYIGASLGMWLMLDAVRRAQKEKRTHLYLGTAYGEKAKYKLNLPALEFWNGEAWIADAKELKHRMRNDMSRIVPFSGISPF